MDPRKLTRHSHRRARSALPLLGHFPLAGARAHEFCGTARRRLALWLMRAEDGPVIWVLPAWHRDRLHMAGVRAEIDPARLIFVEVERGTDLLWVMEEALRAGAVQMVVADLPDPPGLTPVRRLHLAAEAGAEASGRAPLALLLTPGDGGAPGVETRWRLDPAHQVAAERWHLARLRAREAGPQAWDVRRAGAGHPELAAAAKAEPA